MSKSKKQSHQETAKQLGMSIDEYLESIGLYSMRSSNKKPNKSDQNSDSHNEHKSHQIPQKQKTWEQKFLQIMSDHPEYDFIKNMMPLLQCLHDVILSMGSFIDITSNGHWHQVHQQFIRQTMNKQLQIPSRIKNGQSLFFFARSYLFPYYFYFMKRKSKQIKTIYNPEYLPSIFIQEKQLKQGLQNLQKGLSFYDLDILVFRNGQKVINVDTEKLSLDGIQKVYGDYIIDVRKQNPMDYGFIKQRLLNSPFQMSIKEFRQYQNLQNDKKRLSKFKYADHLKGGHIFFGVNFDPEGNDYLAQHLDAALKGTFLSYCQNFDLLSYLEFDVPGCSFPQVYFKVKGCWTGGHCQNLNMSAVNINHGPDASEWYSLDFKYVEDFRSFLKKYTFENTKGKSVVDIITSQGLWYQSLEWFIQHGYPIKRLVQSKGDIVISGPGTLHWVRAHGVALQSAWNIMVKTNHQAIASLHRHAENKKVKFERQSVIPLKTIYMKFLNHEHSKMKQDLLQTVRNALIKWISEEKDALEQLKKKSQVSMETVKATLKDYESFCCRCQNQTLVYFGKDSPKNKSQKLPNPIICLECIIKDSNLAKRVKKIFFRYDIEMVDKLINYTDKFYNKKFHAQVEQLCNGYFIGEIQCSVRKKREASEKQAQNQNNYKKVQKFEYKQKQSKFVVKGSFDKWHNHWANKTQATKSKIKQDQEQGQIMQKTAHKKLQCAYDDADDAEQAFVCSPMHSSSSSKSQQQRYVDGHKKISRSRGKNKPIQRQNSQEKKKNIPKFIQVKYDKKSRDQVKAIFNKNPNKKIVSEEEHNYYKGHIYSKITYADKPCQQNFNEQFNEQQQQEKPNEQMKNFQYFKDYQIHDKQFNVQNQSLQSQDHQKNINQDYIKTHHNQNSDGKRRIIPRLNNFRKSDHKNKVEQNQKSSIDHRNESQIGYDSISNFDTHSINKNKNFNRDSRDNNFNSDIRFNNNNNNDRNSRPKGCFNCGQQGHRVYQCPNPRQNRNNDRNNNGDNGGRKPFVCYNCQKQGHSKRDCPQLNNGNDNSYNNRRNDRNGGNNRNRYYQKNNNDYGNNYQNNNDDQDNNKNNQENGNKMVEQEIEY